MRFLPLALILILAACARAPQTAPPAPGPGPAPRPSTLLLGLSASELGERFGQPRLQLREGPGIKLQWADSGCVLDVFLYPPESGRGLARVTHAEARAPSGAGMAVETCIGRLER